MTAGRDRILNGDVPIDQTDPICSRVHGIAPVLIVHPLLESTNFYHQKLGFSHPQLLGNPFSAAILERDGFRLYLQETDVDVTISPSGGWDLVLRVENLWDEWQSLRGLGVPVKRGPVEIVHGIRQWIILEITDPNGYEICLMQETWRTGQTADETPGWAPGNASGDSAADKR